MNGPAYNTQSQITRPFRRVICCLREDRLFQNRAQYEYLENEGRCRVHILYLISYAGRAGTEKYVRDLMRVYHGRGHKCSLAYWQGGELSRWARSAGYKTLQLELSRGQIPGAARTLARWCQAEGVDVIHAQYPRENVIALLSRLWRPSTRVVFTSHLSIEQGPLWRCVNRAATPFDYAVIALYDGAGALLRRNGICARRIRVVGNGVEIGAMPARRNAIREEFGLGPDCFIFLTLARYAPEKGLETLLASLKKLRTMTSRPFVCAIAGEGRDFDSIGREIRRLSLNDCVLQLGYRTDVETLLCSADAYVSSALYNEAMSFSILEAMRCGLALAVTDVGAGRELAAGCGYVSAPGDAAAVAENLLWLMSAPETSEAMGREARRRVVEEYDLERQADKLLDIYKT